MIAAHPLSGISFDARAARFTWSGMRPGAVGEAIELPEFDAPIVVEVVGDFAGARLEIESSVDGRAYGPLTAPIRKPGSVPISAKPIHIRPSVVGGGVGTFLQCAIVASRA